MSDYKEYQLTKEQYDVLFEAFKPVPAIMLQCGMPRSRQENANAAWCKLGDEMGFDGMTAVPSRKDKMFFLAVPK